MSNAKYWVEQLKLERHPEGGFYKEVYKSVEVIKLGESIEFPNDRAMSTSIYFLLETGDFSTFHRIKSDEIWHFYEGDPLEIFHIDHLGKLHRTILGKNPELNEVFTTVVPANCWFGSRPLIGSSYSLVGCTVSPGFDFRDFEMADKIKLSREYPSHSPIIEELCR
jgi:predicted cupin superfamily sugar epimerase